ncbi:MAG: DUF4301 family protein [Bacteroidota bacterium]
MNYQRKLQEIAGGAEAAQKLAEGPIPEKKIIHQLEMFRKGAPYVKLVRPCTVGDGIRRIEATENEKYLRLHERAAADGRLMKFVPASGAATRMFKSLNKIYKMGDRVDYRRLKQMTDSDPAATETLKFFDNIEKFAFYDELRQAMKLNGAGLEESLDSGKIYLILEYLLTAKGLNYANMPKGMIPFHRSGGYPRTPFIEHMEEAAECICDSSNLCRLHFTVPQKFQPEIERHLYKLRSEFPGDIRFELSTSTQGSSTSTIAVDMDNKPFVLENGNILFRPGGHGTLLDNLNKLKGDIVFIKNIDNVVPPALQAETNPYRKLLGGYIVEIQQKVFEYLDLIEAGGASRKIIDRAAKFCREELSISLPEDFDYDSARQQQNALAEALNRPIRVCGMVENKGEPGGGPFFIERNNRGSDIHIVEGAQINQQDPQQVKILRESTHFNPVDIVCALRDRHNKPFDLGRFSDPRMVFITEKSKDGRPLKALELPGLWNGAMADWITVFVEVPIITFNPVKTINDLLRDNHQTE